MQAPDWRAHESWSSRPALVGREKIALFRSLFRGREDVYPRRFESRKTGSRVRASVRERMGAGHLREAAHQVRGVSQPPIPASDRRRHPLAPVRPRSSRAAVRRRRLSAAPQDETCFFLAVDFDKAGWREDATAFLGDVPPPGSPGRPRAVTLRTRRARWFFFEEAMPAALARRLGSHVLTETMEGRPDIGLDSYDRLFPNQDTMPQGGFGNLIALPLQKGPREQGNSVFLDDDLVPWTDQWAFLASVRRIGRAQVEGIVQEAERRGRILGVRLPPQDDEDDEPWTAPAIAAPKGAADRRRTASDAWNWFSAIRSTSPRTDLHPGLRNRLLRLAAFQNPEFYKAQAMRLSTYDKPRVIACAEDHPHHIGLPRGCLDEVRQTLTDLDVRTVIRDERYAGRPSGRDLSRRAPARAEGRGRRDAGARHRRAGRHDGVRQDGRRRVAHRPARRQHARARASASTARPVDRAAVGVSEHAGEVDRPNRRRAEHDRPGCSTWRSFRAWSGRASSTIASATTAI